MRVKGMRAYIRVREVRGQVLGTTCNGARTNSAINNTVLELHKSARGSGPRDRHDGTEDPRYRSTAPVTGATTETYRLNNTC